VDSWGRRRLYNAMSDPQVSQVTLADMNQQQLDLAKKKLSGMQGAEKLEVTPLDLNDTAAASRLMAGFDAVSRRFLTGPLARASARQLRPKSLWLT